VLYSTDSLENIPMQSLLLLVTGIVAGLTSIPLTYFAFHSHREIGHLRRSHHTLHRLLAEAHAEEGAATHDRRGYHGAEQRSNR
jgi:hypothetical protein